MDIFKTCTKCCKNLSLSSFHNATKGKYGKTAVCRECKKITSKKYRENNKERLKKQKQDWLNASEENRQKDQAIKRKWEFAHPEQYQEIWKNANKRRKQKVLEIVGKENLKCANCGCDKIEFLEVNHKNCDGIKDYKFGSSKFYTAILHGDRDIDDLEILCKPCNALHYLESKYGKQPYEITW